MNDELRYFKSFEEGDNITFKGFENVWFGYTWKNLVEKVGDN